MSWKQILKADLESKILSEIEKEGGALGMKNLKQFGEESKIKQALSKLGKEGKIFMHEDGDIYTHKPEDIEKALEGFLGFNPKQFIDESTYSTYKRKLNEVQNKRGFNKALANIYKNNNKQPLNQSNIDSAAANFIYKPKNRNVQPLLGTGTMGGNDYGFN
jgi:hypothetical protein